MAKYLSDKWPNFSFLDRAFLKKRGKTWDVLYGTPGSSLKRSSSLYLFLKLALQFVVFDLSAWSWFTSSLKKKWTQHILLCFELCIFNLIYFWMFWLFFSEVFKSGIFCTFLYVLLFICSCFYLLYFIIILIDIKYFEVIFYQLRKITFCLIVQLFLINSLQ